MEAGVLEDAARASPEGNTLVDENISRAVSGELSRCDCEHVGSAAEAICEKRDVGITSRHYRERAEVVDADGNAGPFWRGQRDDGRPNCRDVFRAWHFNQLRNHHRVQMLTPIHQYTRLSIRRVRVVPR